ncbi:MAG TPA: Hsp20 family protein [Alphaproteobacteria bacterium]|nr:Hsp20 family protein [Alphaproteobacteria bacterium]
MRQFDLSPLFRASVGFERLSQLLDSTLNVDEQAVAYPPYNIEKLGEDSYRITMAVAGFAQDDIDITAQDQSLVVVGRARKTQENSQYLYRGIAGRAFERRFQLADHIKVVDAELKNGLLHISLVREVPEAKKPRKIAITAATAAPALEQKTEQAA